MFSHRALESKDAEKIIKFPQAAEELFYLFPKANYPLSKDVLLNEVRARTYPTVVFFEKKLAGYGNVINAERNNFCSIGNVIVNPEI